MRAAGCRCMQIEEPTFHFMANTYGKDHDEVKFMIDAFNREVQGLDDVELWIHTCWGNPNMQRVMDDTSYANSIEIYLERCRGDVWTLGCALTYAIYIFRLEHFAGRFDSRVTPVPSPR